MFIIGLTMTSFSIPIAIIMLSVDNGRVSDAFWWAVIATMAGIVLMVFGWMKRNNKALLDSIENRTKGNYCNHCRINVMVQNGCCPFCGKSLKER